MRKIKYLFIIALAAGRPAAAQELGLDPAVRTGKLANGFTYFIRHNEEPKHRVIFYLANKVGSVLENEGQRGLAHFMEHMSFNGTTHFPKSELVDYLQKAGVRFGADLNAYTSFDETVYQLPLPADRPDVLAHGLQIMRDWAQEATLDPVEIDKERGVVLEEKRLGKGAQERMQRQYWPAIFNHSRYAERLPIGTDEVLNNFKPEAIREFYRDWYRPDLQALIVVGDVEVEAMEALIKAKFGDLKNPVKERERTAFTVPLTGRNQFLALTDKEMTATVAEVIIKHPGTVVRTAGDYRAAIMRSLFDRLLAQRYAELSRQADPPYIQGGGGIGHFTGGLDQFSVSVTAKPGELERGFKALWREAERLKRFGFTATELERVRQGYLNALLAGQKEKDKTGSDSYVREYLAYFLKGTAAPGIDAEVGLVKKDLPAITLGELNALAAQYITDTDRDILVLAPEKDKGSLPDEAAINNWLAAVAAEPLEAYKDEVSSLPLLIKPPVAGKVINESTGQGLTTWTLSNGIRVILKPTGFKANEILFTGFAPGGTSLATDADYQSAANAGIIAAFGAGNYDPNQLAKFLSGKTLSARPYIGERSQGISGSAAPKDLEAALQLVYAYYTEPRKDAALFGNIISRSKASIANRGNDPNSVFQDSTAAVLGNYNLRRTGPSVAKLDQIELAKAYDFYQARLGNAAGTTFVFVGSLDIAAIKPLLEKYLGGLATGEPAAAKDLGIHIPEGVIQKNIYKGAEPRASVVLVWSGKLAYSAAEKIRLDALKETLEIRLLERLREDEGGAYSPGTYASASKLPQPRYSLVVQFGCSPANADKLIASTIDEIRKLRADGSPQVNLDKWRAESLRARETAGRTNNWWLGYLSGQLQDQESLQQADNYTDEVQKVSPAAVKKAAEEYLSGKNYIRMVLLPDTGPR